jgi:hypothetical protein
MYYFRWASGSVRAGMARGHPPEQCLPQGGKVLRSGPDPMPVRLGQVTLPFRKYRFDDRGSPLYVFHCIWEERSGPVTKFALHMKETVASRPPGRMGR